MSGVRIKLVEWKIQYYTIIIVGNKINRDYNKYMDSFEFLLNIKSWEKIYYT